MYVIETRFQKEFLKELLYHYQFASNFNLNMAHLRVHKLKILLIKSLTIWSSINSRNQKMDQYEI